MSTENLFTEYLNGLIEERRRVETILELSEQTRQSLLETDAERYQSTVTRSEQEMSSLLALRRVRQHLIASVLVDSVRTRDALLDRAPESIRARLAAELDAYSTHLDRLRRLTVSNNVLLSDRILMLRHLVEGVREHFDGKPGYGDGRGPLPVRKESSVTLMVDAKV